MPGVLDLCRDADATRVPLVRDLHWLAFPLRYLALILLGHLTCYFPINYSLMKQATIADHLRHADARRPPSVCTLSHKAGTISFPRRHGYENRLSFLLCKPDMAKHHLHIGLFTFMGFFCISWSPAYSLPLQGIAPIYYLLPAQLRTLKVTPIPSATFQRVPTTLLIYYPLPAGSRPLKARQNPPQHSRGMRQKLLKPKKQPRLLSRRRKPLYIYPLLQPLIGVNISIRQKRRY